MASAITTSKNDDSESCVLCSSKHNRNRPSFCQCKHCSIPLCLDCMKEHHEELLQDVAHISHQYNELQELLQTRKLMITDETTKSIENVNQYFDIYMKELRDTQHQIIASMEREKQNAQDYVLKIDSDLRTLGGEIQGLTKESIVQMTKAKNLATELKKIEQQLRTYQVTRTENSVETKPEFSIKFDCSSVEIETPHSTDIQISETCQTGLLPDYGEKFHLHPSDRSDNWFNFCPQPTAYGQTDLQEPLLKKNTLNMLDRPSVMRSNNLFGFCPQSTRYDPTDPQEPLPKKNTLNMLGQPSVMQSDNLSGFCPQPTRYGQTDSQEPLLKKNTLNMFGRSSFLQKYPTNKPQESNNKKDESKDSSMSDEDGTDTDDSLIDTSYDIDRMASDGENILYTSYYNKKPDLIAYCLIDDDDDDEDECRDWKKSRIQDMIWWTSAGKFICATEDGVYTVEYINKKFKIICVIRKQWSFIRVAANTTHLFIWVKSVENNLYGIEVYSPKFEYIRTIDFGKYRNRSFVNESISFCVTENHIASINITTDKQNNHKVLQVAFCDMNINELHFVVLGECNRNCEIRTDGKDQFFVTTGGHQLHSIAFQGIKQTINLRHNQYNGKWIAVLNNRRIAISNGRSDIEVVTY